MSWIFLHRPELQSPEWSVRNVGILLQFVFWSLGICVTWVSLFFSSLTLLLTYLWQERLWYTAKMLGPGMDVIESWARSECDHHSDAWSSRQRWSSSLRRPVLHLKTLGGRGKRQCTGHPSSNNSTKDLERRLHTGGKLRGFMSENGIQEGILGENTCWPDIYV